MLQSLRTVLALAVLWLSCATVGRAAATPPPAADQTLRQAMTLVNVPALRRAVEDQAATWPETRGSLRPQFLQDLGTVEKDLPAVHQGLATGVPQSSARATEILDLQRRILLGNPLLQSFASVLLVERQITHGNLGLPQNWEGNSSLPAHGWKNQIARLDLRHPEAPLQCVYRPDQDVFVGDVKLHYDGSKVLFSMPGANRRWQIHELALAPGAQPTELPLVIEPDVDNYDACYLPDGNIIFSSTLAFTGVPCVRGSSHVANLCRYDRATGHIRRLTFDQEHNWNPTVLPDGRVLYLRWEYADIPHFASRRLFAMYPDGTGQGEFYGSNSIWPNGIFYAHPVPGQATMVAGIVSGHHGVPRMGELVLFDPSRGRHEADGVVQRIPGFGQKVEPIIRDQLVNDSWPKFLHPAPLSDKYLLVSAKPTPQAHWGIYLVDVFDNLLLLKEEPGAVLFEPIPLMPRPLPPVIPSTVQEQQKTAIMAMTDVYAGPGLKDVPRGTIKKLRIFTYQYAYQGIGGQVDRVGLDGPWDIKAIVGTVPVEADGSARFTVPANLPISIQPLDARGRAVTLMRSWTTAMPGEVQSCVGCHEQRNSALISRRTLAGAQPPVDITPWHGPMRGFAFNREVQCVLDRYCTSCHNGGADKPAPDLTLRPNIAAGSPDRGMDAAVSFPPAYLALRRYVRGPNMESDTHLLRPYEYHASTTELVQMLEQGHHGVLLDDEAWDRLQTWIDLNTPAHGTWTEMCGPQRAAHQRERRNAMLQKYGLRADDLELVPALPATAATPVPPASAAPLPPAPANPTGWPFDAAEATRRQSQAGPITRQLDLGNGLLLELAWIPPGAAVLGGTAPGNLPPHAAQIDKGFWLARCPVTNEQFARFDPRHDSSIENSDFLKFSIAQRGYPLNEPQQPVCRVSWNQAVAFCQWLATKTGTHVTLPTEDQWEYACRAGTATPFWFGGLDAPFAQAANLADVSFSKSSWSAIPAYRPAILSQNDGYHVASPVGHFKPNPWGLFDMHGNVWQWTADAYDTDRKAVRGGSWSDRPSRATASSRQGYLPWQGVANVGFRVLLEP